MPRISVVVPVYDVEAYLAACLQSIARQSERDLEVIVVDDGSSDASRAIAERFAERDPRFRVVAQPNGGLGSARNTGVAHAGGEFLAFVDGDDVVADDAYRRLLGSLDRTGSDLATGNVQRLTRQGTSQAQFLARTFARSRERTHVTRMRSLLADRTAWNKLYRRSFWDAHGFRFPEGVVHEDIPVTLPAHLAADRVDVLAAPVYQWRLREDGARVDHPAAARVGGAARPARRRRRGHGALPRPRDRHALALVRPQRRRRRPAAAPQPARRGRRGLPRAVLHARQRAARPRVAADLRGAARDRPGQVAAGPARPARRAGGAPAVREGRRRRGPRAAPRPLPRRLPRARERARRRRSGWAGATRTSR